MIKSTCCGDKLVLEQRARVGPLVGIFPQRLCEKIDHFFAPQRLVFEARRRFGRNVEENAHRMLVKVGRLALGHLDEADADRPFVVFGKTKKRKRKSQKTNKELKGQKVRAKEKGRNQKIHTSNVKMKSFNSIYSKKKKPKTYQMSAFVS